MNFSGGITPLGPCNEVTFMQNTLQVLREADVPPVSPAMYSSREKNPKLVLLCLPCLVQNRNRALVGTKLNVLY